MKKFLFSLFLCSLVLILSRFSIPDMPFSIEGFPKDGPQPYVNLQKRAMIPLDSVDKVFYGGISYAVNGDEIHIWQRGFQQQTALKMAVGSNLLYKDELPPFQMDSHPTERDGVIYIPFRAVGEALEHNIFWKKSETRPKLPIMPLKFMSGMKMRYILQVPCVSASFKALCMKKARMKSMRALSKISIG